jgi:gamma-glutamyltranspeptidase/glutathione hydrolase
MQQALGSSPRLTLLGAVALLALSGCAPVEVVHTHEGPSDLYAYQAESDYGMVACGSIEATRIGVGILEQGGNAVDAAVGVALALGSVDPGPSGLGGMTYFLLHLADGRAVAIDGSAIAPFEIDRGRLQELWDADHRHGYEFVAVPTTLATLDHAIERYGTMAMPDLLETAAIAAERGYRLNSNQITWLNTYRDKIIESSDYLRHLVLEEGQRVGRPGDRYCLQDLAATLRRISVEGVESFYRGRLARKIAVDIERGGGFVRRADLGLVGIRELEPLRGRYRDLEIVAFPPPGAGSWLIEILNILDHFPTDLLASESLARHHLLIEASRLARNDHYEYFPGADQPVEPGELPQLGRDFAASRAQRIVPGRPVGDLVPHPDDAQRQPGDHTTQISVVDQFGNAVAITQTLGAHFGAKVATPGLGFPYNSLLENFDFDDPYSADFIRPRRRVVTPMTPTIALEDGVFRMALGSAGSERISPVLALVISNVVDRGMDLRDAIIAPRVMWGGLDQPKAYIELLDPHRASDADALEDLGYTDVYRLYFPPRPVDLATFGGVNAVAYDAASGIFTGVGDPRRSGYAEGPQVSAGR